MLPVLPVLLNRIAAGVQAEVVLGNALHLALDRRVCCTTQSEAVAGRRRAEAPPGYTPGGA